MNSVLRTARYLVILLLYLSPSTVLSETLVGLVIDSAQTPLSNVRVELVGFGTSDYTSTNGEFRIQFPDSKVGTRATLQVLKAGFRPKDPSALSLTLPRNSSESPITIELIATSRPAPSQEKPIRTATNGECLIVVYKFKTQTGHDITPDIFGTLRSELMPGPVAGLAATMSTWRVEQYNQPLGDTGAVALGKKLGALFIVTGISDGHKADLTLTLTERRLLLADEEMSQIGLRLGDTAISLSAPLDEMSAQLIPITIFLRGVQLYLVGSFDSAARHLTSAIEKSPAGSILAARASYLRGICYFLQGDYARAEADYDKALAFGLDVAAVHWRRAQVFIRAFKDHDSVEKDLRRGIELSGQSAQAYYVSGLLTFETMDQIHLMFADMPEYFSAADDYLRVAMEKEPKRLAPVLVRVKLHEHYGDILSHDTLSDISKFVQMAIERGGDRAELRFVLARLYMGYRKPAEAIGHYQQALKLGAPSAIIHFELAQANLQLADAKSATENLNAFLQTKGTEPNQWWLRALAKAELSSIDSGAPGSNLFEKLNEQDASSRKEKLSTFISGWLDKTWNYDFLGSKSTEDFLLYALTETNLIPKVPDNGSAGDLLHALLGPLVMPDSGTPPLWCEAQLGRGELIIVERKTPGRVITTFWPGSFIPITIPLEVERLLVILGRDEKIKNITLDDFRLSFYSCRNIRTNLRLAFSGD